MRTFARLSFAMLLVGLVAGLLSACEEGEHHKIEIKDKPGKFEVETK